MTGRRRLAPRDKTIFLAVDHGFSARYILRTDIFRRLRDANLWIVILTPNADEEYFRREFSGENVFVERYEIEKCTEYLKRSILQRLFRYWRDLTAKASADLGTIKVRHRRYRLKYGGGWSGLLRRVMEMPVHLLRHSRWLRRMLVIVEGVLYSPEFHKDLFDRYRPELVALTQMGNWGGPDAYLMREAHNNGARVVSVVLSWDNTSARGIGGARPDYVVAWTEKMKQELTEYYDIREEQIFVGGVAHWDPYYSETGVSRSEFFAQCGLDPDRRVVLFGTGSPTIWADANLRIIETLGRAIAETRLAYPCQLLVRVHPIYLNPRRRRTVAEHLERLQRLAAQLPHVTLHVPAVSSQRLPFDLPASDIEDLGAMLRYCDVLVNTYSTLMLEASIFSKPIINVCFDTINPQTGLAYSAFLDYPHLKRILATGGTRAARSPSDLVHLVNLYLEQPELDEEGRTRIRRSECGPFPGTAGQRVADFLLGLTGVGDRSAELSVTQR